MKSDPTTPTTASLNPFATAPAVWIEDFLRLTCADGLRPADRAELEDQIEALVPAVVELRNGGHIQLNAAALASFASSEGFWQLANDARLSDLARRRCEAIRVRMVVQGVKALLGHN